jgi:hypothetical protein
VNPVRRLRLGLLERTALNQFAQSRFDGAIRQFERLLALDPERRGARFNVGMALLSLGRPEEALRWFEDEAARFGDSLPLRMAQAEAAWRGGDRQRARAGYAAVLKLKPPDENRALAQLRLALCDDADRFREAMMAQPLVVQADGLLAEKRHAEAEELYARACALDESCYQAFNNLGALRLDRKDFAGARDALAAADRLVSLPRIKANLAYLEQRQQEKGYAPP